MPVKVYTSSSNVSCRKAISWLEKYEIPYIEKNLSSEQLTTEEFNEILSMTYEGTDEILSKKSNVFKKLTIDFESISLNQFYNIVLEYPGLLRLPILMDDIRLQIGYSKDEIRQFLPRYLRVDELNNMMLIESRV